MTSPFTQPDFPNQTETPYKTNIDNAIAVLARLAAEFNAQAQGTPDMTVAVLTGHVWDGSLLTEIAAANTDTIVAPSVNPRIDRIELNRFTGAINVITGVENASPSAPAYTTGAVPIAQFNVIVSQTEIVNADITDERDLRTMGLGDLARDDIDILTQDDDPVLASIFFAASEGGTGGLVKVRGDKIGAPTSYAVQTFTADGTYTKPAGLVSAWVRVVSGGGGGGNGGQAAGSANGAGGGGGGGGYAEKLLTAASIGATEVITVGAGGAGGTGSSPPDNGAVGESSSFGSIHSTTGGAGGIGANGGGYNKGGAGGVGSGGDLNVAGQPGHAGIGSATPDFANSGAGGSTPLGGGGVSVSGSQVGTVGGNYGGGGAGGSSNTSTDRAGGAGADGVIIVIEFLK